MANAASQCRFTNFVAWLGVLLLSSFWCASAMAALGVAERAEVDNELRALLKISADKYFPGMPLPKIRVASDLRTFQQGIESGRALAYFRCPDNDIVLHPGYVTPTGDSSAWATGLRALRDTLRHELGLR